MLKNSLHIVLSFLLLLALTGVSTANITCSSDQEEQQMEAMTSDECCLLTKEFQKLTIAISSERASIVTPEADFIPASLINSDLDFNVAMQHVQHSELLYQTPLRILDIPVLNQNFRI